MSKSIAIKISSIAATTALLVSMAPAAQAAPASSSVYQSISLGSSVTIKENSVSLANAKRAAQNYLKVMGFSRKGLINQLVFEGYSASIAAKAVDSLKVNWNTQAGKVAKNYIKLMAFSRKGLIDQLMFDGFTAKQAAAGAKAVGY
jgi:Host cell surface-exposed lipoprotein